MGPCRPRLRPVSRRALRYVGDVLTGPAVGRLCRLPGPDAVARPSMAPERQALVAGEFELDGVAWSPDGRWISFRSRMAGLRMKNFLIPSSGGTPAPLSDDDREQGIASWSADSTQFVFGDVPAVFGVPAGAEVLHVHDVARKTSSAVPGSDGLWTARWSPDGRFIAALMIDRRHQQRMRLFDTLTKRWRTLDAVHVDNPSWSHDSRFVYYNTEGSTAALMRVRVADGRGRTPRQDGLPLGCVRLEWPDARTTRRWC